MHGLQGLLCFSEALGKTVNCGTKESGGGDWGIKLGGPVCVLDFHEVEPQVALQHDKAGNRPCDGLCGSLNGAQGQICRTVQVMESS